MVEQPEDAGGASGAIQPGAAVGGHLATPAAVAAARLVQAILRRANSFHARSLGGPLRGGALWQQVTRRLGLAPGLASPFQPPALPSRPTLVWRVRAPRRRPAEQVDLLPTWLRFEEEVYDPQLPPVDAQLPAEPAPRPALPLWQVPTSGLQAQLNGELIPTINLLDRIEHGRQDQPAPAALPPQTTAAAQAAAAASSPPAGPPAMPVAAAPAEHPARRAAALGGFGSSPAPAGRSDSPRRGLLGRLAGLIARVLPPAFRTPPGADENVGPTNPSVSAPQPPQMAPGPAATLQPEGGLAPREPLQPAAAGQPAASGDAPRSLAARISARLGRRRESEGQAALAPAVEMPLARPRELRAPGPAPADDLAQGRAERVLPVLEPAYWQGEASTAALPGGAVEAGSLPAGEPAAAASRDAAQPYPAQPSATSWLPRPGADRLEAPDLPAPRAVKAADARRAGMPQAVPPARPSVEHSRRGPLPARLRALLPWSGASTRARAAAEGGAEHVATAIGPQPSRPATAADAPTGGLTRSSAADSAVARPLQGGQGPHAPLAPAGAGGAAGPAATATDRAAGAPGVTSPAVQRRVGAAPSIAAHSGLPSGGATPGATGAARRTGTFLGSGRWSLPGRSARAAAGEPPATLSPAARPASTIDTSLALPSELPSAPLEARDAATSGGTPDAPVANRQAGGLLGRLRARLLGASAASGSGVADPGAGGPAPLDMPLARRGASSGGAPPADTPAEPGNLAGTSPRRPSASPAPPAADRGRVHPAGEMPLVPGLVPAAASAAHYAGGDVSASPAGPVAAPPIADGPPSPATPVTAETAVAAVEHPGRSIAPASDLPAPPTPLAETSTHGLLPAAAAWRGTTGGRPADTGGAADPPGGVADSFGSWLPAVSAEPAVGPPVEDAPAQVARPRPGGLLGALRSRLPGRLLAGGDTARAQVGSGRAPLDMPLARPANSAAISAGTSETAEQNPHTVLSRDLPAVAMPPAIGSAADPSVVETARSAPAPPAATPAPGGGAQLHYDARTGAAEPAAGASTDPPPLLSVAAPIVRPFAPLAPPALVPPTGNYLEGPAAGPPAPPTSPAETDQRAPAHDGSARPGAAAGLVTAPPPARRRPGGLLDLVRGRLLGAWMPSGGAISLVGQPDEAMPASKSARLAEGLRARLLGRLGEPGGATADESGRAVPPLVPWSRGRRSAAPPEMITPAEVAENAPPREELLPSTPRGRLSPVSAAESVLPRVARDGGPLLSPPAPPAILTGGTEQAPPSELTAPVWASPPIGGTQVTPAGLAAPAVPPAPAVDANFAVVQHTPAAPAAVGVESAATALAHGAPAEARGSSPPDSAGLLDSLRARLFGTTAHGLAEGLRARLFGTTGDGGREVETAAPGKAPLAMPLARPASSSPAPAAEDVSDELPDTASPPSAGATGIAAPHAARGEPAGIALSPPEQAPSGPTARPPALPAGSGREIAHAASRLVVAGGSGEIPAPTALRLPLPDIARAAEPAVPWPGREAQGTGELIGNIAARLLGGAAARRMGVVGTPALLWTRRAPRHHAGGAPEHGLVAAGSAWSPAAGAPAPPSHGAGASRKSGAAYMSPAADVESALATRLGGRVRLFHAESQSVAAGEVARPDAPATSPARELEALPPFELAADLARAHASLAAGSGVSLLAVLDSLARRPSGLLPLGAAARGVWAVDARASAGAGTDKRRPAGAREMAGTAEPELGGPARRVAEGLSAPGELPPGVKLALAATGSIGPGLVSPVMGMAEDPSPVDDRGDDLLGALERFYGPSSTARSMPLALPLPGAATPAARGAYGPVLDGALPADAGSSSAGAAGRRSGGWTAARPGGDAHGPVDAEIVAWADLVATAAQSGRAEAAALALSAVEQPQVAAPAAASSGADDCDERDESGGGSADELDDLAATVYDIIRRRLATERERSWV